MPTVRPWLTVLGSLVRSSEGGAVAEVEVNGVRLHYEVSGDGPPLVFVHGMCGRGAVWAGQVERLSDEFTCVTYDRRGHGASSDGDAEHSVPLHADDFAALVRSLGFGPVVCVGSSGGARIGLAVVLRHAGLLAGAVLSEPPVFSLAPERAKEFMGRVAAAVQPRMDTGDLPGAVDAFFGIACPGLWRMLDDADKEPYRQNGPMLVADLGQPPFLVTADDLTAVTVPVLAVLGRDSDPFLQSTPRVIADSVPSAQLVELTDCGHVTYAEQPDAFAAAVRAFAPTLFGPGTRSNR
jgi:3-oxoadipate enol-lactonase